LAGVASEAFFLARPSGKLFCVLHRPSHEAARGAVLYAHPFAEEMNKTRRMASLGARSLAADGWATLLLDLTGCGDSTGDFGEATWERWREDFRAGWDWLAQRFDGPRWLWGLRAGCLLAAEVGRTLAANPPLVLWQPVLSGKQHLGQFLRLRLARERIGGAGGGDSTQALRAELAGGCALEIAGYEISPALARSLDAAELNLEGYPERVRWLEVATGDSPELGPGARAKLARWSASGARIDARAVPGIAFWQTVEITECPALVEATVAALAQASP
jgi:exosortase A-associated hydrolase 2